LDNLDNCQTEPNMPILTNNSVEWIIFPELEDLTISALVPQNLRVNSGEVLIIEPLPCLNGLHSSPFTIDSFLQICWYNPCPPWPPCLPISMIAKPPSIAELNASELPTKVIQVIMTSENSLHVSGLYHCCKEAWVNGWWADAFFLLHSCKIWCIKAAEFWQWDMEICESWCWIFLGLWFACVLFLQQRANCFSNSVHSTTFEIGWYTLQASGTVWFMGSHYA